MGINTDDATKAIEAGTVTLKDGITIAKITKATAQEDTRRHRGYGRGSYRGRGGRFDYGRGGGGYEGDEYYRYGSSYGGRGYGSGRRGYPFRYPGGRAGGAGGRLYYGGGGNSAGGRGSEGGYHHGNNHGSQYNRGGNNQYGSWHGGYGGGDR